jgi:hypothetical protein
MASASYDVILLYLDGSNHVGFGNRSDDCDLLGGVRVIAAPSSISEREPLDVCV